MSESLPEQCTCSHDAPDVRGHDANCPRVAQRPERMRERIYRDALVDLEDTLGSLSGTLPFDEDDLETTRTAYRRVLRALEEGSRL